MHWTIWCGSVYFALDLLVFLLHAVFNLQYIEDRVILNCILFIQGSCTFFAMLLGLILVARRTFGDTPKRGYFSFYRSCLVVLIAACLFRVCLIEKHLRGLNVAPRKDPVGLSPLFADLLLILICVTCIWAASAAERQWEYDKLMEEIEGDPLDPLPVPGGISQNPPSSSNNNNPHNNPRSSTTLPRTTLPRKNQ